MIKIIKASFEIVRPFPSDSCELLERIGRTCYKSEDKITPGSAEKFVRMIIKNGHHSVLEHISCSVKFIIDRGISHELVRHRLCAFSQESTRYCGYRDEFVLIKPSWLPDRLCGEYDSYKSFFPQENGSDTETLEIYNWFSACAQGFVMYKQQIKLGEIPGQARSVLPNSLKTEIVCTTNLREWRHILTLRCSEKAHEQMREVMLPLLEYFYTDQPILFEDVYQMYFGEK
jgi:thymidylate synthase (FAD)